LFIDEIILQDENFHLHRLVKVKDTIYDSFKKEQSETWLWIYLETSEFFYFDLWEQLDHAQLNQNIKYKENIFKVISINNNKIINYS
jgi:hypothetical protein